MKGKLIVHIGPPKTGTTSLQYFWMNYKKESIKYLGVIQPRGIDSISRKLYLYTKSISEDKKLRESIEYEIRNNLQKYRYVIISEEMFLVQGKTTSFLQKLEKLYEVTESFETIITFCIRDVEKAYFSYYMEIFHNLPLKLQSDFDEFQRSSYGDCFKYEKIYKTLVRIGFKKINYFYFNALISGDLTMENILGIEDSDYSFKVKLNQENITKKKNSNLIVKKRKRLKTTIVEYNHLIPEFLKGYGIGSRLMKKYGKDKIIKLKEREITKESKNIFKDDLFFFNSLTN